MKADTAEILVDEHVLVRRFCWLRHDEVPRLDELSHKLRSLNGESTGRVQRPALLSSLLLSGLDLAESKAPTLVVFTGIGVRYVYPLKLEDAGRVKRLSRSPRRPLARLVQAGGPHLVVPRRGAEAAPRSAGVRPRPLRAPPRHQARERDPRAPRRSSARARSSGSAPGAISSPSARWRSSSALATALFRAPRSRRRGSVASPILRAASLRPVLLWLDGARRSARSEGDAPPRPRPARRRRRALRFPRRARLGQPALRHAPHPAAGGSRGGGAARRALPPRARLRSLHRARRHPRRVEPADRSIRRERGRPRHAGPGARARVLQRRRGAGKPGSISSGASATARRRGEKPPISRT